MAINDLVHTHPKIRERRNTYRLERMTPEDVKVFDAAGQEYEKMHELVKLEYQFYKVSVAQKARYRTQNRGW